MIRTRFAPSPTGMLHIGSARTALYNYLFAKHHGGQFLLRIEDTDKERSTNEAVAVILQSMKWLGLNWDGEPVFQSSRAARHAEVAAQLLARGHAYPCYCSPEELAAARQHAKENHLPPRYSRVCRDRMTVPDAYYGAGSKTPAIRLKVPLDGGTVLNDLVQGTVTVNHSELDDMIILREDGTPTYLLAVVVDDHDMGITHVIRGDDHLTNTFRQIQIYKAMGWELPQFAHIPLIHGPDGKKYSKRHGAESVLEYEAQGYLPEALNNYLLRLGWGHGNDEIISRERAIELFDIGDVGQAAARMDFAKLLNLNGVYMRQTDDVRLAHFITDERYPTNYERVLKAMPALKERAKTVVELCVSAQFLITAPTPMEFSREDAKILEKIREVLIELKCDITPDISKDILYAWAAAFDTKIGKIAQPLRLALTGSKNSPPIDIVMHALGKDECVNRLSAVIVAEGL